MFMHHQSYYGVLIESSLLSLFLIFVPFAKIQASATDPLSSPTAEPNIIGFSSAVFPNFNNECYTSCGFYATNADTQANTLVGSNGWQKTFQPGESADLSFSTSVNITRQNDSSTRAEITILTPLTVEVTHVPKSATEMTGDHATFNWGAWKKQIYDGGLSGDLLYYQANYLDDVNNDYTPGTTLFIA